MYVPGGTCQVETELVWTSPDGTQAPIVLPADFYGSPNFSPDGTRVSVTAMGAYDTLFVLQLERGTLTRVTFGVNAAGGGWDLDGEHVFVGLAGPEETAVARVRADGTGEPQILHRLAPDRAVSLFGLVSVGGQPALLGGVEGQGIVLLSTGAEAEVTPVVADPLAYRFAAMSPDERCLAYVSTESGRSEIYLRPFPAGAGRTQVSNAGGTRPLWSEDGRWLLYNPSDAEADPSRRVAVATRPGDCLTITSGTPTPMPAPPMERVLETRPVKALVQNLDVIAIQGWADTLKSPATPAAP